jgi:hypothetical protein
MAREAEKQVIETILHEAGVRQCSLGARCAADFVQELLRDEILRREICHVYRQLGGADECPARPGSWDIVTDELFVEFDEAQHFNRYRLITLRCPLYGRLPHFPLKAYQDLCSAFERACLDKACGGKYWTSPSTERQFGASDPPKVLGKLGAARWKQRAFYDMLKDFAPLVGSAPVARVSLWDALDQCSMTVAEAIASRSKRGDRAILRLVLTRAGLTSHSPQLHAAL